MGEAKKIKHFGETYDKFADAIFRHCYFRVFDRELAKDLMQETFMRTWKYIVNGGEIKNIRAFLYTTVNNLIVDDYRKRKTISLDELKEKGFVPKIEEKDKIQNIVEGKEVINILNKLDTNYRQVIIMRYIDELSPKEIAKVLKETEDVVSVRIHRGLKKLRQLLKHE